MNVLELKIPPLLLVFIFGAVMWGLAALWPAMHVVLPLRVFFAAMLMGAGVAFVLAGAFAFRRAKTTMNPIKPQAASSMVVTGVYRFSRNPMYAGLLFILLGWAVYLAHALAFFVPPLFVVYMTRYQILPEERALAAKFGAEFAAYKKAVRRWL